MLTHFAIGQVEETQGKCWQWQKHCFRNVSHNWLFARLKPGYCKVLSDYSSFTSFRY